MDEDKEASHRASAELPRSFRGASAEFPWKVLENARNPELNPSWNPPVPNESFNHGNLSKRIFLNGYEKLPRSFRGASAEFLICLHFPSAGK
jgi:hypothetical protein